MVKPSHRQGASLGRCGCRDWSVAGRHDSFPSRPFAGSRSMHKSATPARSCNPLMGIESPRQARRIIRAGDYAGHTAGIAPNYVQGNLCILPKDLALEFAAFCQKNPKPCPLIGMSAPGDPRLLDLGDIDIRTDLPCYRVYKDRQLVAERTEYRNKWNDHLI